MLTSEGSSDCNWRRFRKDNRGAVIVWFAITLPVILGMFALSLDLGRYKNMHSELKDMADAAALAAANALDGTEEAIEKANAAAAEVINNSKFVDSWGDGPQIDLIYAENWEDLNGGSLLLEGVGPEAKKAAWVQAITNVGTVKGLIIDVLSGDSTMTASVRSTAGTRTVACAVQPLFVCLPSAGITLTAGKMVRVKREPGKAWGPGNFGLVDPPYSSLEDDETGQKKAKQLKKNLAQSDPDICYVDELKPSTGGVAGPVKEGFNVRFDIWDNNIDEGVKIPPGPNNFKGLTYTGACVTPSTKWTDPRPGRMPRDSCFPDACGGPYGNGVWNGKQYWETHYEAGTYPADGFKSRFAMYMAELGLDVQGNALEGAPAGNSSDPEFGKKGPVCASQRGITGVGTWKRRIIYAAMIDCEKNAEWLNGNSTKSPIKNADLGMFFLTEPTQDGQELYMEFVKRLTKGDDEGKLHDVVQLYPNPQDGN